MYQHVTDLSKVIIKVNIKLSIQKYHPVKYNSTAMFILRVVLTSP